MFESIKSLFRVLIKVDVLWWNADTMHCVRGGMYRNAVYIVYFKLENKKLMDKSKLVMWAQCDLKSQLLQTLVARINLTESSDPCYRFFFCKFNNTAQVRLPWVNGIWLKKKKNVEWGGMIFAHKLIGFSLWFSSGRKLTFESIYIFLGGKKFGSAEERSSSGLYCIHSSVYCII